VFGDLVEAQLLVIIGADPFGGVDRAFLQCRINVAARDLLRDDAELGEHLAAEAGDTHLDAAEIGGAFDFLAEPAEALPAGVAHRNADDAEAVVNFIDQALAIAIEIPGIVLAYRQAERQRAVEDQRRVLADVVAAIAVAALHGAVRDRVEHL